MKSLTILGVLLGAFLLLIGSPRALAQDGDTCTITETIDTDAWEAAIELLDSYQPLNQRIEGGVWLATPIELPGIEAQPGGTMFLMGNATLTAIEPEPILYYVTATTNANLRSGATTDSAILGSAAAGAQFPVIASDSEGDWYWVRLENGDHVWISAQVAVPSEIAPAVLEASGIGVTAPAYSFFTTPSHPLCAKLPNALVIVSPENTTTNLILNGVNVNVTGTAIFTTLGYNTDGALSEGDRAFLFGTNVQGSLEIVPPERFQPNTLSEDGESTGIVLDGLIFANWLNPITQEQRDQVIGNAGATCQQIVRMVGSAPGGAFSGRMNLSLDDCARIFFNAGGTGQDTLDASGADTTVVDVPGLEDETTGQDTTAVTVPLPTATRSGTVEGIDTGLPQTFDDAQGDVIICNDRSATSGAEADAGDIVSVVISPSSSPDAAEFPFPQGRIAYVTMRTPVDQTLLNAYSFAIVFTGRTADGTRIRWLLQIHQDVMTTGQIDDFFNAQPDTQNQVRVDSGKALFNIAPEIIEFSVEAFHMATPNSPRVCDIAPDEAGMFFRFLL